MILSLNFAAMCLVGGLCAGFGWHVAAWIVARTLGRVP